MRKRIDKRYEVDDEGIVYGDGLPLEPIGGVGVNLHGKRVKIAYLVARAFVPNQEMREFVRHKNGNVQDNSASNLEWCDRKEEKRRGRKGPQLRIVAYDCEGERVGMWGSVEDAAKDTRVRAELIKSALRRKQKRAGGLLWVYIV